MTTDSFLLAVFRFNNIYGNAAKKVWCDNGSNLVGGANELRKSIKTIDWDKVHDKLSNHLVNWYHIPPFSPHKAGCWERLVGMSKKLILDILNEKFFRDISGEDL